MASTRSRSTVAEPIVPRVGALADARLRDLSACDIVDDLERCASLTSSILLLKRTCVCELVAATDLSESVTGILVATSSVTEQVEEDYPVKLISESPCTDAKLYDQTERTHSLCMCGRYQNGREEEQLETHVAQIDETS